ncbi:MAG: HEAT repeat domain-containing protein [Gemmatimonadaceae bacterium]
MRSTFVALLAIASATPVAAQLIASRVAQAPAGIVHLQFDGRPGVCGDGRETIAFGEAIFARGFQSFGRWNGVHCVPGPLRVSLTTSGGQVTRLQTQVGGSWPSTEARVTDLGVVPSHEASAYFFSLVPRLEAETGKDRVLLPAVLAEGADVMAPLLALARDESRLDQTRRQAVQWLGLLGDASVIPALVSFAKQDVNTDGEDKAGKKGVASSAVSALSQLDGDIGVPALIDLAKTGSIGTRRNAAFWLGQNGDPRARKQLHAMIEDTKEEDRVRQHAIFSLSHGDETPPSEFAYLRSVYPRLDSEQLKEAVFQGMTTDASSGERWLIERARDSSESTKLRKSALFWAGQDQDTPTADLMGVYRDAGDSNLREHAIFVLSQRQDEPATDALIRIAREDKDSRMRGKALFWLAQKKDPRVTKLISDMVLK